MNSKITDLEQKLNTAATTEVNYRKNITELEKKLEDTTINLTFVANSLSGMEKEKNFCL